MPPPLAGFFLSAKQRQTHLELKQRALPAAHTLASTPSRIGAVYPAAAANASADPTFSCAVPAESRLQERGGGVSPEPTSGWPSTSAAVPDDGRGGMVMQPRLAPVTFVIIAFGFEAGQTGLDSVPRRITTLAATAAAA